MRGHTNQTTADKMWGVGLPQGTSHRNNIKFLRDTEQSGPDGPITQYLLQNTLGLKAKRAPL